MFLNCKRVSHSFSEDVFDFSKGEMTQLKIKQLKESLNSEFYQIFQLCDFVMTNSQKPRLLSVTLETLLKYLSWIPLGYIFETPLIQTLLSKVVEYYFAITPQFFEVPDFRNVTLQCLTEIGQLQIGDLNTEIFAQMFGLFMQQLYKIVPPNTDLRTASKKGSEDEKNFIQNLAIFFGTFFASHRKDLEQDRLLKMVIDGHFYLVQLSTVDDLEVFRICLDYWHQLTSDLYHEAPVNSPLMLESFSASTPRRQLYKDVLSKVRDVVISRMAKPEEVIVVEVCFIYLFFCMVDRLNRTKTGILLRKFVKTENK